MKTASLNRRDFLKVLGLSPLLFVDWERYGLETIRRSASPQPPNILVIVFDAMSARNLSLYGYPRQTTPNLERIARQATVFHRHYAAGNFTSPGTASMLTGVYPWTHRALQMRSQTLEPFSDRNIFALLSGRYHTFAYTHNPFVYTLLQQFRGHIDQLTKIADLALLSDALAERLLDYDYFVANEAELLLLKAEYDPPGSLFLSLLDQWKRKTQTRQLIEANQDQYPRGLPNCRITKGASQCFDLGEAIDWIRLQASSQPAPFLGYVHLFPPHAPYNVPKQYNALFRDEWKPPAKPQHHFTAGEKQKKLNMLRREYDEYIAYVDAEFGRLYDALQEDGVLENTCLIFTTDHGEMLERGISGHANPTLYEPIIQVPLLISKPGQKQRQDILIPTSAVDLLPTLLELAGEPQPAWVEGRVLPGFAAQARLAGQSVFALEAKQSPKIGTLTKATASLIKDDYKLIYYTGYPGFDEVYELYDLGTDTEEMQNLYSPSNDIAQAMKDELLAKLGQVGAVQP